MTSNVWEKNKKGDRNISFFAKKINVHIAALQKHFSKESLELLLEVLGLMVKQFLGRCYFGFEFVTVFSAFLVRSV